jgi:hypothetical protein
VSDVASGVGPSSSLCPIWLGLLDGERNTSSRVPGAPRQGNQVAPAALSWRGRAATAVAASAMNSQLQSPATPQGGAFSLPRALRFRMPPHEDGPSHQDRERERQRNVTRRLLAVIGALVAAIVVSLLLRWL